MSSLNENDSLDWIKETTEVVQRQLEKGPKDFPKLVQKSKREFQSGNTFLKSSKKWKLTVKSSKTAMQMFMEDFIDVDPQDESWGAFISGNKDKNLNEIRALELEKQKILLEKYQRAEDLWH